MPEFKVDMVGGIPVMSEAEFRQAKAKAAAEENAQQEAAATLLAAEASVAKQDRGNQVRARKGSALRKRAAAAAAREDKAAADRAQRVEEKLATSATPIGIPLVQSDGRRSSDPKINLNQKAPLTGTPFKRPEKIDVAPGSPRRPGIAELEAEKRQIEMGLEMGRLRLEEKDGEVFCVQTDTNERRHDLDPMRHGIKPPEVTEHFEDGYKTIKRGMSSAALVDDHAIKQKRELRRQSSMHLEEKAAAFLASLK